MHAGMRDCLLKRAYKHARGIPTKTQECSISRGAREKRQQVLRGASVGRPPTTPLGSPWRFGVWPRLLVQSVSLRA
eukprot:scaffold15849_cov101-Isochrysis_galbana.AAC.5